MNTELLTIEDFCKTANVGRTVAYRLINQGRVKACKLGRKTLIPRASIEAFIADLEPYEPQGTPVPKPASAKSEAS